MFSGCGGCFSWLQAPKQQQPQTQCGKPGETSTCANNDVPEPACEPDDVRCFSWEACIDDVSQQRALCEAMASRGFAILRLPDATQELVAKMQPLATEFFGLPRGDRCGMGKLRLFKDKVIGYRELGGGSARFLEIHRLAGLEATIPRPKKPPTMSRVAAKLHVELQGIARSLLTWLAEYAELPPAALLQAIDEASLENLEDGDCGASVLRLGCYGWEPDSNEIVEASPATEEGNGTAAEPKNGEQGDVVFHEHTDASFLTLAPVGSAPGLQIRDPSGCKWLDVEQGLDGRGGHLVVFGGDFLEVLTKGKYAAARHQVVDKQVSEGKACPEAALLGQLDGRHRLSMPFLVRGQPSARLNTAPFLDERPDLQLLRLEDMEMAELRRFLDMKGRRRFQGHMQLSASPALET